MNEKKPAKQPEIIKEQQDAYEYIDNTPDYSFIEERYEIIEGIRYDFLSSPSINHQVLVTELSFFIRQSCQTEGIIIVAPMDVHLDQNNILQPDIIFISNENTHIIRDQKIFGAPDLVIEILSPSTSKNDKIRKKSQYANFGVKEYWIIDHFHHVIDQFMLANDKFILHATYGLGDTLISDKFPCISINLSRLFHSIKRFEKEEH